MLSIFARKERKIKIHVRPTIGQGQLLRMAVCRAIA
jgi:hypothetical protein